MSTTAGAINNISASWLNNPSKSIYTDAKLLVTLAQAQRDLQDALLENDIGFLKKKYASPIDVAAAATTVTLPSDFYEPISLRERRDGGTADDWIPVDRVEFITDETIYDDIRYWTYNGGIIEVNPPRVIREVELFYRAAFTVVSSTFSVIPEDEFTSYLAFRSAAIAAATIGENENRAKVLEASAGLALGTLLRMGVKQNQGEPARRLPYRSRARRNMV